MGVFFFFFTFLHVVGKVMMECPARGKELSWGRDRDDQQLVSGVKKINKKKLLKIIASCINSIHGM